MVLDASRGAGYRNRSMRAWLALLLAWLALPSTGDAAGEPIYSFENGLPPAMTADPASHLGVSRRHALHGDFSLAWDWAPGSSLEFARPVAARDGSVKGQPASTAFALWVYCEAPHGGALRVEFLRGGKVAGWFDFRLAFRGWRTAWVLLGRDLQEATSREFDGFRIRAPSAGAPGKVWFDAIIPEQMLDRRFPTADDQVTTTNPGGTGDHWTATRRTMDLRADALPAPSAEVLSAVERLGPEVEATTLATTRFSEETMEGLRRRFGEFGLRREEGAIRGEYVPYAGELDIWPEALGAFFAARMGHTDILTAGKLLLDLARVGRGGDPAARAEAERMYVELAGHLLDQGWAEGHARGTHHHLGYQTREYFTANFLMREALGRAGLREATGRAMQWFSSARRCLLPPEASDLDEFNTVSRAQLCTILMIPEPVERARLVGAFARFFGAMAARVTHDNADGFKCDGTAFHHWGHYPAYAKGAFLSGSMVFRWFADKPFRLPADAYENFNRALMATRIFSNRFDWPNAVCGRHPFDGDIRALDLAFLNMALAGTPDGSRGLNPALAAAYLRLWGEPSDPAAKAAFAAAGARPEPDPSGHWVFNHAAHAVHRREGWMVSVKGYNKHVWASEIYFKDNRYGRNQSNGAVEIFGPGGRVASGFAQEGWDWNRPPGATCVHLPLEKLDSPREGTTMYTSPEAFAGGSSLGGSNGVFGMVLNEAAPFYGNKLRARKSVFCFDERVVCLGTGISSANKEFPVETALFQNLLPARNTPTWFSAGAGKLTGFPWQFSGPPAEGAVVLGDAVGNSYFVPGGQRLRLSRVEQVSRHNKTREETRGDFATAWLDHGAAPKDARYHYAVLVGVPMETARGFALRMATSATAPYRVARQDDLAHAVEDRATGIFACAAFSPVTFVEGPLLSVGSPSLVMVGPRAGGIAVSVCDPDLRFPEKPVAGAVPPPPSEGTSLVRVRLRGGFRVEGKSEVRVVKSSAQETELEFPCRWAQPVEVALAAVGDGAR